MRDTELTTTYLLFGLTSLGQTSKLTCHCLIAWKTGNVQTATHVTDHILQDRNVQNATMLQLVVVQHVPLQGILHAPVFTIKTYLHYIYLKLIQSFNLFSLCFLIFLLIL
jgi:hypothetical protein